MGQDARKALAEDNRRQAIHYKHKHQTKDAPRVSASSAQLGTTYGVGIGLYFKIIAWLRALLLWLALAAVPFMIVINTSTFTTEDNKGKADAPGLAVVPQFNPLQSWTFAAILDDRRDQGILSWMNIRLPGLEGVFPMNRAFFLEWISIVDACSMAVFSVACMFLYKMAATFVKSVDDATMEVADYTVVVKGLPTNTTPQEVGRHFTRFGKVMDVVMVKDFGPLLSLTAQATDLKDKHNQAKERSERGHNAAIYEGRVAAAEKKLAKFYEGANKRLGWVASWFQHRSLRFGEEQHRFWVEQAKPPEDYIYENLHYSRLARLIRSALVMLMVFAILLISAAAVTKLMAINISASRNLIWSDGQMVDMINVAMQNYPLNATQAVLAPVAANSTLVKVAAIAGQSVADQLTQTDALQRTGYCTVHLQQTCSSQLGSYLGTEVSMQAADKVQWANLADSLLKSQLMYSKLQEWSTSDSPDSYPMCYPCYCYLISVVAAANAGDGDWVHSTREECSTFIGTDVQSYVIKSVMSGVTVILNIILKQALQLLVSFEKHWTKSDHERHYAVMAFVSQLLNSVLVVLLVNARSSSASAVINKSLSGDKRTSWGANVILSGAFTDFTPSWYVDVGQSLELIIIINAALTVVLAWLFWFYRKLRQCVITNFVVTASQQMYNSAWIGDNFVLDYRVSDTMLGLWIILMFGSGMPGIYIYGLVWLTVMDITDRWYLVKMCQQPVRYGKSLPYLLLGVLPWAAATHCAFGLWMHTYFNAGSVHGLSNVTNKTNNAKFVNLTESVWGRRITQINGLPLLILLAVHLGMHVFIRFLIYFFSSTTFSPWVVMEENEPEIEITYERALAKSNDFKAPREGKLSGTPTYRLPHHPRYRDLFGDNAAYKPLWFKAFGRDRYTQLVSRLGGGFAITKEPVMQHDDEEVHKLLEGLGERAQNMARKLADGDNKGSLTPTRDRSQSVHVAVVAGLDSPKGGSLTGSPRTPKQGRRHTVMGPTTGLSPDGLGTHSGSFVASGSAAGLCTSRTASSGPFVDVQGNGFSSNEIKLAPAPPAAAAEHASPTSNDDGGSRLHSVTCGTRMSALLMAPASTMNMTEDGPAGPGWMRQSAGGPPPGWALPFYSQAAEQQQADGETNGLASRASSTAGDLLWGGVIAAASAARRAPSVSLTPYASSGASFPFSPFTDRRQASVVGYGQQHLSSQQHTQDADPLGSMFARPAELALDYQPLLQPDGNSAAYPNVHLTTVELPAGYEATPKVPGSEAAFVTLPQGFTDGNQKCATVSGLPEQSSQNRQSLASFKGGVVDSQPASSSSCQMPQAGSADTAQLTPGWLQAEASPSSQHVTVSHPAREPASLEEVNPLAHPKAGAASAADAAPIEDAAPTDHAVPLWNGALADNQQADTPCQAAEQSAQDKQPLPPGVGWEGPPAAGATVAHDLTSGAQQNLGWSLAGAGLSSEAEALTMSQAAREPASLSEEASLLVGHAAQPTATTEQQQQGAAAAPPAAETEADINHIQVEIQEPPRSASESEEDETPRAAAAPSSSRTPGSPTGRKRGKKHKKRKNKGHKV